MLQRCQARLLILRFLILRFCRPEGEGCRDCAGGPAPVEARDMNLQSVSEGLRRGEKPLLKSDERKAGQPCLTGRKRLRARAQPFAISRQHPR
jgi:hypothetical protein